MKKTYITITAIIISSIAVYAQTEAELKTQLDAVTDQIMSLRQANMRSPQAQQLRESVRIASDNYQQAIESLPGIKDIDTQISALRKQMMTLQKRKMDLIRKNESTLQLIKKNRDDSAEALRNVIRGGEQGKALQAEQRRLMKEISKAKRAIPQKTAPAEIKSK